MPQLDENGNPIDDGAVIAPPGGPSYTDNQRGEFPTEEFAPPERPEDDGRIAPEDRQRPRDVGPAAPAPEPEAAPPPVAANPIDTLTEPTTYQADRNRREAVVNPIDQTISGETIRPDSLNTLDNEAGMAANGADYWGKEFQKRDPEGLKREKASLDGEVADYNARWAAYADDVNNGRRFRDPTFEASMDGEDADLGERWGDWRKRYDEASDILDVAINGDRLYQEAAGKRGDARYSWMVAQIGDLDQALKAWDPGSERGVGSNEDYDAYAYLDSSIGSDAYQSYRNQLDKVYADIRDQVPWYVGGQQQGPPDLSTWIPSGQQQLETYFASKYGRPFDPATMPLDRNLWEEMQTEVMRRKEVFLAQTAMDPAAADALQNEFELRIRAGQIDPNMLPQTTNQQVQVGPDGAPYGFSAASGKDLLLSFLMTTLDWMSAVPQRAIAALSATAATGGGTPLQPRLGGLSGFEPDYDASHFPISSLADTIGVLPYVASGTTDYFNSDTARYFQTIDHRWASTFVPGSDPPGGSGSRLYNIPVIGGVATAVLGLHPHDIYNKPQQIWADVQKGDLTLQELRDKYPQHWGPQLIYDLWLDPMNHLAIPGAHNLKFGEAIRDVFHGNRVVAALGGDAGSRVGEVVRSLQLERVRMVRDAEYAKIAVGEIGARLETEPRLRNESIISLGLRADDRSLPLTVNQRSFLTQMMDGAAYEFAQGAGRRLDPRTLEYVTKFKEFLAARSEIPFTVDSDRAAARLAPADTAGFAQGELAQRGQRILERWQQDGLQIGHGIADPWYRTGEQQTKLLQALEIGKQILLPPAKTAFKLSLIVLQPSYYLANLVSNHWSALQYGVRINPLHHPGIDGLFTRFGGGGGVPMRKQFEDMYGHAILEGEPVTDLMGQSLAQIDAHLFAPSASQPSYFKQQLDAGIKVPGPEKALGLDEVKRVQGQAQMLDQRAWQAYIDGKLDLGHSLQAQANFLRESVAAPGQGLLTNVQRAVRLPAATLATVAKPFGTDIEYMFRASAFERRYAQQHLPNLEQSLLRRIEDVSGRAEHQGPANQRILGETAQRIRDGRITNRQQLEQFLVNAQVSMEARYPGNPNVRGYPGPAGYIVERGATWEAFKDGLHREVANLEDSIRAARARSDAAAIADLTKRRDERLLTLQRVNAGGLGPMDAPAAYLGDNREFVTTLVDIKGRIRDEQELLEQAILTGNPVAATHQLEVYQLETQYMQTMRQGLVLTGHATLTGDPRLLTVLAHLEAKHLDEFRALQPLLADALAESKVRAAAYEAKYATVPLANRRELLNQTQFEAWQQATGNTTLAFKDLRFKGNRDYANAWNAYFTARDDAMHTLAEHWDLMNYGIPGVSPAGALGGAVPMAASPHHVEPADLMGAPGIGEIPTQPGQLDRPTAEGLVPLPGEGGKPPLGPHLSPLTDWSHSIREFRDAFAARAAVGENLLARKDASLLGNPAQRPQVAVADIKLTEAEWYAKQERGGEYVWRRQIGQLERAGQTEAAAAIRAMGWEHFIEAMEAKRLASGAAMQSALDEGAPTLDEIRDAFKDPNMGWVRDPGMKTASFTIPSGERRVPNEEAIKQRLIAEHIAEAEAQAAGITDETELARFWQDWTHKAAVDGWPISHGPYDAIAMREDLAAIGQPLTTGFRDLLDSKTLPVPRVTEATPAHRQTLLDLAAGILDRQKAHELALPDKLTRIREAQAIADGIATKQSAAQQLLSGQALDKVQRRAVTYFLSQDPQLLTRYLQEIWARNPKLKAIGADRKVFTRPDLKAIDAPRWMYKELLPTTGVYQERLKQATAQFAGEVRTVLKSRQDLASILSRGDDPAAVKKALATLEEILTDSHRQRVAQRRQLEMDRNLGSGQTARVDYEGAVNKRAIDEARLKREAAGIQLTADQERLLQEARKLVGRVDGLGPKIEVTREELRRLAEAGRDAHLPFRPDREDAVAYAERIQKQILDPNVRPLWDMTTQEKLAAFRATPDPKPLAEPAFAPTPAMPPAVDPLHVTAETVHGKGSTEAPPVPLSATESDIAPGGAVPTPPAAPDAPPLERYVKLGPVGNPRPEFGGDAYRVRYDGRYGWEVKVVRFDGQGVPHWSNTKTGMKSQDEALAWLREHYDPKVVARYEQLARPATPVVPAPPAPPPPAAPPAPVPGPVPFQAKRNTAIAGTTPQAPAVLPSAPPAGAMAPPVNIPPPAAPGPPGAAGRRGAAGAGPPSFHLNMPREMLPTEYRALRAPVPDGVRALMWLQANGPLMFENAARRTAYEAKDFTNRVFINYGMNTKFFNALGNFFFAFSTYNARTPLQFAERLIARPGNINRYLNTSRDVAQMNEEQHPGGRRAGRDDKVGSQQLKVQVGDHMVDYRDLLPFAKLLDPFIYPANVVEQQGMRQDPVSRFVRVATSGFLSRPQPFIEKPLQKAGVLARPQAPADSSMDNMQRLSHYLTGRDLTPQGIAGGIADKAVGGVGYDTAGYENTIRQMLAGMEMTETRGAQAAYSHDAYEAAKVTKSGPLWDEAVKRANAQLQQGRDFRGTSFGRTGIAYPNEDALDAGKLERGKALEALQRAQAGGDATTIKAAQAEVNAVYKAHPWLRTLEDNNVTIGGRSPSPISVERTQPGRVPSLYGGMGVDPKTNKEGAPGAVIPGDYIPATGTPGWGFDEATEKRAMTRQQQAAKADPTLRSLYGERDQIQTASGVGSPQDIDVTTRLIAQLREPYANYPADRTSRGQKAEQLIAQQSIKAENDPVFAAQLEVKYGIGPMFSDANQKTALEVLRFEDANKPVHGALVDAGYFEAQASGEYDKAKAIVAGIDGAGDYLEGLARLKEQNGWRDYQLAVDRYGAAHPELGRTPRTDDATFKQRYMDSLPDGYQKDQLTGYGNVMEAVFANNPDLKKLMDRLGNLPAGETADEFFAQHPELSKAFAAAKVQFPGLDEAQFHQTQAQVVLGKGDPNAPGYVHDQFKFDVADPAVSKAVTDREQLRNGLWLDHPEYRDLYDRYLGLDTPADKAAYKKEHPDLFAALDGIDQRIKTDDAVDPRLASIRESEYLIAAGKQNVDGFFNKEQYYFEQLNNAERQAYDRRTEFLKDPKVAAYFDLVEQLDAKGGYGQAAGKAFYLEHKDEWTELKGYYQDGLKKIGAETGADPIAVTNRLKVAGGETPLTADSLDSLTPGGGKGPKPPRAPRPHKTYAPSPKRAEYNKLDANAKSAYDGYVDAVRNSQGYFDLVGKIAAISGGLGSDEGKAWWKENGTAFGEQRQKYVDALIAAREKSGVDPIVVANQLRKAVGEEPLTYATLDDLIAKLGRGVKWQVDALDTLAPVTKHGVMDGFTPQSYDKRSAATDWNRYYQPLSPWEKATLKQAGIVPPKGALDAAYVAALFRANAALAGPMKNRFNKYPIDTSPKLGTRPRGSRPLKGTVKHSR